MDALMEPLALRRALEQTTLSKINERLAVSGLSITSVDAQLLAERRAASLADTERVEFGAPAAVTIAEAIATSPYLTQDDVASVLADLSDSFYMLRDELPARVPDTEIAEALRGCLDAWSGAAGATTLTTEEVMAFSQAYMQAAEAERDEAYRIVDDKGRTYVFDPAEWDYDERSDGWDGERWADDWRD
ncbi:MAG: hypothetical protein IKE22_07755 [Atopobiaceae bacterium]|nr:hypothetical protein [Atopobiaceae bacterium]